MQDTGLLQILTSIHGVGPETAKKLQLSGLTKLEDLHKYSHLLSDTTKLWLQMKPNDRILRVNILRLEPVLLSIATKQSCILGSYARNSEYSSDIDVLLVSDKPNSLSLYHSKLMKLFPKSMTYSFGTEKLSCLIDVSYYIPDIINPIYKLDVFSCRVEDRIPYGIYLTGSGHFNIIMRRKAKSAGFLLNQHGLFKDGVKQKIKTEREYFKAINMDWKSPQDR